MSSDAGRARAGSAHRGGARRAGPQRRSQPGDLDGRVRGRARLRAPRAPAPRSPDGPSTTACAPPRADARDRRDVRSQRRWDQRRAARRRHPPPPPARTPNWMRNRWLALGDFVRLLHRTSEPAPTSLMQGDLFAADLADHVRRAVAGADRAPPSRSGTASRSLDVLLDVATTDLRGERRAFRDAWGATSSRASTARCSASGTRPTSARRRWPRPRARRRRSRSRSSRGGSSRRPRPWPGSRAALGDRRRAAQQRPDRRRARADSAPPGRAPGAALRLLPERRPAGGRHRPTRRPRRAELRRSWAPSSRCPRSVPFVDQLDAIERAMRRGEFGADQPALRLVELDRSGCGPSAASLLEAYRHRRRIASLEDLLGDPAAARAALRVARARRCALPGCRTRSTRCAAGSWQWGLRRRRARAAAASSTSCGRTRARSTRSSAGPAADRGAPSDRRRGSSALDGLRRAVVAACADGTPRAATIAVAEISRASIRCPRCATARRRCSRSRDLLGDLAASRCSGLGGGGLAQGLGERALHRAAGAGGGDRGGRAVSSATKPGLPPDSGSGFAQLTPFTSSLDVHCWPVARVGLVASPRTS